MKVHIEDNIYLESDERQFIIRRYTGNINKQTGQEIVIALGHFNSIRSAIKFLIKMKLKQSTATNLRELLQEVGRIEKWVVDRVDV